jgi:aspartyl protease family protein
VVVGNLRLADVRASVNAADMSESLLGMTFLSRLGGFEVSGDRLTLRR